jgi:hypothetical protein
MILTSKMARGSSVADATPNSYARDPALKGRATVMSPLRGYDCYDCCYEATIAAMTL